MPQRKHLRKFAELVTRETGIRMPENKLSMLRGRLERRLRQLKLSSLAEYESVLSSDPEGERRHLFDAVTTNKTDFFREPKHFDYLRNQALPALHAERPSGWHCRVWCAGCSSGEEPYTLAMVLREYERAVPGFSFSILATDISTRVLELARSAIYPEAAIEPVPPDYRRKYLLRSRQRSDARVRIAPELRRLVRFQRLNFMDDAYRVGQPDFDLIFFRNVLIYFDKPTQQAVVQKQCKHLRPGGYFFISHSESLMNLRVPLRAVSSAVFRRT